MPFEVTLESDLGSLGREFARAAVEAMREDVQAACEEAIADEQAEHPYQDRTYQLTDTAVGKLESSDATSATGVLVWPQDYASYVDEGTRHARAFPFVERTVDHAGKILLFRLESTLERTLERLSR